MDTCGTVSGPRLFFLWYRPVMLWGHIRTMHAFITDCNLTFRVCRIVHGGRPCGGSESVREPSAIFRTEPGPVGPAGSVSGSLRGLHNVARTGGSGYGDGFARPEGYHRSANAC